MVWSRTKMSSPKSPCYQKTTNTSPDKNVKLGCCLSYRHLPVQLLVKKNEDYKCQRNGIQRKALEQKY